MIKLHYYSIETTAIKFVVNLLMKHNGSERENSTVALLSVRPLNKGVLQLHHSSIADDTKRWT